MHEIMEKTFELIDWLEESEIIRKLEESKEKIENNIELKKLIEKGNKVEDKYILMDLKNKLYQYDEYKNYMHYYNELRYIVMDINSRYRKIINMERCFK